MGKESLDDLLSKIDGLVSKPTSESAPKPGPSEFKVKVKEVQAFTDWMYTYAAVAGEKKDGDEISSFKDTAIILIAGHTDGQYFPGSESLRKKFKEVKREKDKEFFFNKWRELRNEALSHVLLANKDTIPEVFHDKVSHIQERYPLLEGKYKKFYDQSMQSRKVM